MPMQFKRAWRHWSTTQQDLKRRFTVALLDQVEELVKRLETQHSGEIEVVLEAHLHWWQALYGRSTRHRALELFSLLRTWDTEHNNGVLIYVCLADRAVEIVADRGFNEAVPQAQWAGVCEAMNNAFQRQEWASGLLQGVAAVGALINQHYPQYNDARNELPDRPLIL
jgi:uncharacterized membrane protein